MSYRNRLRSTRGFTLIELMIVVAIVAILAMLAYPSYLSYVRKSRRTDAKTALLDLASREEKFFSVQNTYTSTPANLGYSGNWPVDVPDSGHPDYAITVTAASTTGFTAQAVPQGDQVNDTCGTYQIDDSGHQTNTGNTTSSTECW